MKKIFRFFWISLVLLVFAGTFYYLWQKSQPVIDHYELISLSKKDILKKTLATGKIEPRDEVLIKPQISGIITEIYKEAGQEVTAGEAIAKVKVIPEMGQLNAAQSGVKKAEINFDQTTREYDRMKELFDQEVVAKEEFEQMKTSWENAKESLQQAQDQLEIVTQGISKRSGKFNNTVIRATISGTILDVPVKVGNSVILSNTFNDGTTIASVANLKDMIFRGDIDETEVGQIRKNMPLKLLVGAMQNHSFDAQLEYISPKARENAGTILFEIKAAAQIPDSINMRAGYSANAEIILEQRKDVLSLPENCISFEGDSTFVYVLQEEVMDTEEQQFTRIPIEIGLSDGLFIEVKNGLSESQKVRGNKLIKEG